MGHQTKHKAPYPQHFHRNGNALIRSRLTARGCNPCLITLHCPYIGFPYVLPKSIDVAMLHVDQGANTNVWFRFTGTLPLMVDCGLIKSSDSMMYRKIRTDRHKLAHCRNVAFAGDIAMAKTVAPFHHSTVLNFFQ